MTQNEIVSVVCALVVLVLFGLAYWWGRGDGYQKGYERGRLEAPGCGHAPCPLAGQRVRVEIASGPPRADVAQTYALPAGVVEAARTEAEERIRRAEAETRPNPTRVPDELRKGPK